MAGLAAEFFAAIFLHFAPLIDYVQERPFTGVSAVVFFQQVAPLNGD